MCWSAGAAVSLYWDCASGAFRGLFVGWCAVVVVVVVKGGYV